MSPTMGIASSSKPPFITSIIDQFSPEALGELQLWLGQNPPTIPLSQISGFTQFVANYSEINTFESTSSNTYTDLATVGPQITGLPVGKYLFIFGAMCQLNAAATTGRMALNIDGATPTDTQAVTYAMSGDPQMNTRAIISTLTNTNGTIVKSQYHTSAALSIGFQYRWLISLRYA